MSSWRLIHPALECTSRCPGCWHGGTAEGERPHVRLWVKMALPGFWGKGVYFLGPKMLHGLGLKGSKNRWLGEIRNVTCLSCKALSNSPFKVQADHLDWGMDGSGGVKRLRGFSCPSKSEQHSFAPRRTTPSWLPNSLPLETRRGASLPHGGTLSLNSEWGPFYTRHPHSSIWEPGWVGRQGTSIMNTFQTVTSWMQTV